MKTETADLVYQTCLECRKNKMCHPMLAVCEECWNTVIRPAIGLPAEPTIEAGGDE